jgi:hypothetical protein
MTILRLNRRQYSRQDSQRRTVQGRLGYTYPRILPYEAIYANTGIPNKDFFRPGNTKKVT